MNKIKINMLYSSSKSKGHGVLTAYNELVQLLKKYRDKEYEIVKGVFKKSDIVHIHSVDFQFFLRVMCSFRKNKIAYVHFLPHTLNGSIKIPKFSFKVFKWYVIKFYKSCNYLVVVNPIFIKELESYGIAPEKIKYIPNFVSKENFYIQNNDTIKKTREKYNIRPNDHLVISIGQVQTRKGVKDFVECAKMLPDVKFIWCGSFSFGKITDGYDELKELFDNPPSNVNFVGIIPRDEINDLLNICDVFFLASYDELFPMSILEACSVNKPVLLRNLELYEDILFNKYISGSSNEEFCESILKLKNDKDFYNKALENSKYISDYYSEDRILKEWDEFYTMVYNKTKK